jgi:large subunit ribosomal protein L21
MYAFISTGGKQARVAEGDQVHVELLDAEQGSEVALRPVLLVDGDTVLATPDQLKGASVTGKVVGWAKRRRFGHRQQYQVLEITSIKKG